jgi:parallel beta-helix repeat protein
MKTILLGFYEIFWGKNRLFVLFGFLLMFPILAFPNISSHAIELQFTPDANTYYVSPGGNDNDPGTFNQPWKTPQKAGAAAVAGDTIIFRGGVYYGQLTPQNSGNLTDGWITFKAYPEEEPIIIHDSYWSRAINIDGVNFIEVNGITAEAAGENGPAIGINEAHHIRIINCTARNSATSGIATTYGIDYITIEGNRVFGNSNIGQYNGSAINIWSAGGPIYDNAPGYHVIIRNNIVYNNRNLTTTPTDGNGIILDNNDLGGTLDLQNPKTLIANNVIFNNGGRCIQLLNSSNTDILHNTCYHNVETERISEGCGGEINLQRTYSYSSSVNIQVYNNIVYGKGGTCNNGSSQAYVFQVFCSNGCPEFSSDYNLWYNGAVYQLGSNDLITDPMFQSLSLDPAETNLKLKSNSPAIDRSSDQFAEEVPEDFLGFPRPWGIGIDMGAYENVERKNYLPLITNGYNPYSYVI